MRWNAARLCSKDRPTVAGLPSKPAQSEALQSFAPSLLFPCWGHQEFTGRGGWGEGRGLGRDLHVKGAAEPHCCSLSPNLHVCPAQAPVAETPALQPFPLQSSRCFCFPTLTPGSTMKLHELPPQLRCPLWHGLTGRILAKHRSKQVPQPSWQD